MKMNERSSAISHAPPPAAPRGRCRRSSSRDVLPAWRAERARARAARSGCGVGGRRDRRPGLEAGEVAKRLGRIGGIRQPGPVAQMARLEVLVERRAAEEARCRCVIVDRQVRVEAGRAGAAAARSPRPAARGTAAPKAMIVSGSREWITAEWPAPPIRSSAQAASMPRRASGTRDEPQQREELLARERLLGDDELERARPARVLFGAHPDAGLRRRASASLPIRSVRTRPSGNSCSRTPPRSLGPEQAARPGGRARARGPSAHRSSTISDDSFVHRIELSKRLRVDQALGGRGEVGAWRRRARARCRARRRCAGFPERYAARTTARPPVATMTSVARVGHQRLDQRDRRLLDHLDHAVRGAGADRGPAERDGRRRPQTSRASGCGLTTTALRVISASSTLK